MHGISTRGGAGHMPTWTIPLGVTFRYCVAPTTQGLKRANEPGLIVSIMTAFWDRAGSNHLTNALSVSKCQAYKGYIIM